MCLKLLIERTFLTSREGTRLVAPDTQRFNVESASLREALLEFVTREDGRILGTITETAERAVCTGWTRGRLYVLVAQPVAD